MKNYGEIMQSFLGQYDEAYCLKHGLFVSYNPSTKLVEYITKAIDLTHQDVILTDLNFIFGEKFEVSSEDKEAEKFINDLLKNKDMKILLESFVVQGLILGTTAMRFGFDQNGNMKFDVVRLLEETIKDVYDDDTVELKNGEYGYVVEYSYKNEKHENVRVKEVFTNLRYERHENGELIKSVPNRYGVPWVVVGINSPSLTLSSDKLEGEGEYERLRPIVDEINSLHAKMDRIENMYADPKVLVTGATEAEIKFEDNAWLLPNHNGSITLLEFKGNILEAMLNRLDKLEKLKRATAPETIITDIQMGTGEGMRMKLQKLTKKIMRLRENYFQMFEKMFKVMYKLQTNKDADFKILVDLVIPQDFDSLLKEATTLYTLNAISLRTLLEKLGYDYTTEINRLKEEQNDAELRSVREIGISTVDNMSSGSGLNATSVEEVEGMESTAGGE